MDYRSFVAEQARAGDPAAQRALEMLTKPLQGERDAAQRGERHSIALSEVRAQLDIVKTEAEARYERARADREQLPRLQKPASLDRALEAERRRIENETRDGTQLTEAERAQLERLVEEKQSWNPLVRAAATRQEAALRDGLQSRQAAEVSGALREFEGRDAPMIAKRLAAAEREYRRMANTALALEKEMRDARTALRQRIPQVEHQLLVLERAGVAQFESYANRSRATFEQLAIAVDQQFRALPNETRREVERTIRRAPSRDRSMESMSMGDL